MEITYTLPAPPDAVFAQLSDMRRFVAAHPYLQAATPCGDEEWNLTELITLGGIRVRFSYKAIVTSDAETHTVRMISQVNALVHLQLTLSLAARAEATVVTEVITIRAPYPIRLLFGKIKRPAHAKMFKRLAATPAA